MFQPRHEVSLALAYLRMGASVTNKFPITRRWALVTGTSVMSSWGQGQPGTVTLSTLRAWVTSLLFVWFSVPGADTERESVITLCVNTEH